MDPMVALLYGFVLLPLACAMSWGSSVGGRTGFSSVMYNNQMVVFGGSDGYNPRNDIMVLSPAQSWSKPYVSAPEGLPAPRSSHSAVVEGSSMIIFGGFGGTETRAHLNDVWSIDLETWVWQKIAAEGDAPVPRSSCSAVWNPKLEALCLWGGFSTNSTAASDLDSDLFLLYKNPNGPWIWDRVAGPPAVTHVLAVAPAIMVPDKHMVMFFGGDDDGRSSSAIPFIKLYDFDNQQWLTGQPLGYVWSAGVGTLSAAQTTCATLQCPTSNGLETCDAGTRALASFYDEAEWNSLFEQYNFLVEGGESRLASRAPFWINLQANPALTFTWAGAVPLLYNQWDPVSPTNDLGVVVNGDAEWASQDDTNPIYGGQPIGAMCEFNFMPEFRRGGMLIHVSGSTYLTVGSTRVQTVYGVRNPLLVLWDISNLERVRYIPVYLPEADCCSNLAPLDIEEFSDEFVQGYLTEDQRTLVLWTSESPAYYIDVGNMTTSYTAAWTTWAEANSDFVRTPLGAEPLEWSATVADYYGTSSQSATAQAYGDAILIYGGLVTNRESCHLEQMLRYDVALGTISYIPALDQSKVPPLHSGSQSAMVDDTMYIFGGLAYALDYVDDAPLCVADLDERLDQANWNATNRMLVFNAAEWNWLDVTFEGAPSARAFHTLLPVSSAPRGASKRLDSLILYGGVPPMTDPGHMFDGTMVPQLADLVDPNVYWLDLGSKKWTTLTTTGNVPLGRMWHSAIVVGKQFLVYGGLTSAALSNVFATDLFSLDLDTHVWTIIPTIGTAPGLQLGPGSAQIGNFWFMYGGGSISGPIKSINILDTRVSGDGSMEWVTFNAPPETEAKENFAMVAMGHKLVTFGDTIDILRTGAYDILVDPDNGDDIACIANDALPCKTLAVAWDYYTQPSDPAGPFISTKELTTTFRIAARQPAHVIPTPALHLEGGRVALELDDFLFKTADQFDRAPGNVGHHARLSCTSSAAACLDFEASTVWINGISIEGGGGPGEGISLSGSDLTMRHARVSGHTGGGINAYNTILFASGLVIEQNSLPDGKGAGVLAKVSTVTLEDVVIRDNQILADRGCGGGIFIEGTGDSVLLLSNVDFLRNTVGAGSSGSSLTTGGEGGGLCADRTQVVMRNGSFVQNSAGTGGGLYFLKKVWAQLYDVVVFENSASNEGGGLHIAFCDDGEDCLLTIQDCTITHNAAESGGGLFVDEVSYATITDTVISDNHAEWGGGLFVRESGLTITEGEIERNWAFHGGGGVFWEHPAWLEPAITANFDGNNASYGQDKATGVMGFALVDELAFETEQGWDDETNTITPPIVLHIHDYYNTTVTTDFTTKFAVRTADVGSFGAHLELTADHGIANFSGLTLIQPVDTVFGVVLSATGVLAGRLLLRDMTSELCRPGYFDSQGKGCKRCESGRFMDHANKAPRCDQCDQGFEPTAAEAATSCRKCQSGTWVNATGNVRFCTACDLGRFAPNNGSTFCHACEKGSYANSRGLAECVPCARGKYGASKGLFECINCPAAQYSHREGSAECFACVSPGMDCDTRVPVFQKGYRAYYDADKIVSVDACPLGYCTHGGGCGQNRKNTTDNLLCRECIPGFTEWNGACVECAHTNGGFVLLAVAVAWLYIVVLHVKTQGSSSADAKVALYFFSTARFLTGPQYTYLAWIGFIDFSPTSTVGASCIAPLGPYEQLAIKAMVTPIFCFLLLVTMGILFVVHRIRTPSAHFSIKPFTQTALAILIFSTTAVSQVCFTYLHCEAIGGGADRLVKDSPSIDCNADRYKAWLPLVVVLLIGFVILFPLLLSLLLCRLHRTGALRTPKAKSMWGIAFETYSPKYYWWEPIALLRRSMLPLLSVMPLSAVVRGQLSTIACILFLLLHVMVQPFENSLTNKLESFSLTVLALLATIQVGVDDDSVITDGQQIFCSLLIFIPAFTLAFYLIADKLAVLPCVHNSCLGFLPWCKFHRANRDKREAEEAQTEMMKTGEAGEETFAVLDDTASNWGDNDDHDNDNDSEHNDNPIVTASNSAAQQRSAAMAV